MVVVTVVVVAMAVAVAVMVVVAVVVGPDRRAARASRKGGRSALG